MADSAAWTLSGIAPPDNTFRDAGEDVHRAYWKYIAGIGQDRFHWRCNQGVGANGQPLTPIAASTARRGRKRSYTGLGNAGNPPLVPALGLSRFESLLRGRGYADHAEWYWTVDPVTGLHWGQMALWHAQGGGGRYPKRNVIGWSAADVAWLRAQGQLWWYAHQHGQKIAEAMATLETHRDKFPRLAAAAPKPGTFKVRKGERTDIENAVFGVGGTAEMSRRAIEAGTATGFRVSSGGWGSKGGAKAAPPKPKPAPTVPIKPKAAPAPKVKRPAAVAQPANPLASERAIPAPAPAAVDLADFAAKAKAAARSLDAAAKFGGEKVFVAHAHSAYVRIHGPIQLADFKQLLGRALHARHIDLSRADQVEAFDLRTVEASLTFHPYSTREFHFLNLD